MEVTQYSGNTIGIKWAVILRRTSGDANLHSCLYQLLSSYFAATFPITPVMLSRQTHNPCLPGGGG